MPPLDAPFPARLAESELAAYWLPFSANRASLDGASHIAALIVEPMTGSAGVFASPQGYLQRLREITRAHGILLIFDEVITGFGRLGHAFVR